MINPQWLNLPISRTNFPKVFELLRPYCIEKQTILWSALDVYFEFFFIFSDYVLPTEVLSSFPQPKQDVKKATEKTGTGKSSKITHKNTI